jgi:hypothetical protein
MDYLRRHGKEVICANRQCASIDDEVEAFLLFLYGLTPGDALIKAGIASGDFWLKK